MNENEQLLYIIKSHIQFAFIEPEGLHVKFEWVEKDAKTIKALKRWLTGEKSANFKK